MPTSTEGLRCTLIVASFKAKPPTCDCTCLLWRIVDLSMVTTTMRRQFMVTIDLCLWIQITADDKQQTHCFPLKKIFGSACNATLDSSQLIFPALHLMILYVNQTPKISMRGCLTTKGSFCFCLNEDKLSTTHTYTQKVKFSYHLKSS